MIRRALAAGLLVAAAWAAPAQAAANGTVHGVVSGLTEDLSVRAYQVGGGSVDGEVTADGHYTISVPAGQYRISVDTAITGTQYVPQQTRFENGTVFTVADGQTVTVDETVRPVGAVGGILKQNGGRPVHDQRVELWSGDQVVDSQYSGDEGDYFFRGVPPGDYRVSWRGGSGPIWVPGTTDRDQADVVTVRPYGTTTANTRDVAAASLSGRLTLADGTPVPEFSVSVDSVPPGRGYGALTRNDGTWRLDSIEPGDYVVSFERIARDARTQYAYGTENRADAHVFTFAPGSATVVDDTWTLGGTLLVTAVDAVTGGPAAHFCAYLGDIKVRYCTDTDVLAIPGISPGPTTVTVEPTTKSTYLPHAPVPVTIGTGEPAATVTVPLEVGGRINAQVVERATGKPAFDFCLELATPGAGGSDLDSQGNCTNRNGKVTTYAVPAGTYQVFVHSSRSLWLGAQWVGATGGTGNQKEALKIKVKNGKVARLPLVQLDPGEDITGTVRDAAGAPVAGVNVSLGAWPLGGTPPWRETYADGKYTLYGLGPYEWPVLFTPKTGPVPRQWSGATGNRFQAATVVPGDVGDHTLVAGSRLTGTVTTDRPFTTGRITAVNAATGDELAIADFTSGNRTYDMPIIGGGAVLLRWTLTGPDASGTWPDKVSVPASGTGTVDLTIPGS